MEHKEDWGGGGLGEEEGESEGEAAGEAEMELRGEMMEEEEEKLSELERVRALEEFVDDTFGRPTEILFFVFW